MNVLATRPSEHNADWQALLENAGFTALPCPVIEIVEVSEAKYLQAVKQKILALDEYYALIFVSRNAVHYGLNWIDKYWPQLPVDLMWFAVGKQTAKCLLNHPLLAQESIIANADLMTSEALLNDPGLQAEQIGSKKVLIFRGVGGHPVLADTLRERGAEVDYCELYHRAKPEVPASLKNSVKESQTLVVPVFSGETLTNFCELFEINTDGSGGEKFNKLCLVVPSERVFHLAKKLGFPHVVQANNASETAMLSAVKKAEKILL